MLPSIAMNNKNVLIFNINNNYDIIISKTNQLIYNCTKRDGLFYNKVLICEWQTLLAYIDLDFIELLDSNLYKKEKINKLKDNLVILYNNKNLKTKSFDDLIDFKKSICNRFNFVDYNNFEYDFCNLIYSYKNNYIFE